MTMTIGPMIVANLATCPPTSSRLRLHSSQSDARSGVQAQPCSTRGRYLRGTHRAKSVHDTNEVKEATGNGGLLGLGKARHGRRQGRGIGRDQFVASETHQLLIHQLVKRLMGFLQAQLASRSQLAKGRCQT